MHQSPAFGEDDFRSCRRNDVAMVNPIDSRGVFVPEVPLVGGQFFRHANSDLVDDLSVRGLLFRHVPYEHSYPHCWRCHTALLYYAQPSWYIRTTQVKDALLRENEATTWHPATIKHGRYGDWLENNIDWALSRARYWGTPLPIWRCADDHQVCVGSLAELSTLTGADQSGLDPHRPYVDDVVFPCPTCGEEARRVPEVIDGWFDSGSMPFAQWGYPHVEGSRERFEQAYPADFICEAIDQTRGWFYTLMAIGTLVFDESSYRNVLCLGHILAEDGRKMSKHLGNILEPIPLMDEHGADAVRWFMAAGRVALGSATGRARQHPGDRPQGPADLLEHRLLPGALRQPRRVLAARHACRGRGRPARPRPLGALGGASRRPGRDLGVRAVRHAARRHHDRGVRRRPVQLVRATLAASLLER